MKLKTFVVTVGIVALAGLTACSSGPDTSTPEGVVAAVYQAVDDGRYQDICDNHMRDAKPTCAAEIATRLATGGADYNGIGEVTIDPALVEIDGDDATVPVAAMSWPGGAAFPFMSDELLERTSTGQWVIRRW